MAVDMTPKTGDTSIMLPITFDYHGGRSSNWKGKVVIGIADVAVVALLMFGITANKEFVIWQKVLFDIVVFYIGLLILRFVVFKEQYYSDIYETLKENDYELKLDYIWQIFDIDVEYPYICYYRNGYKGIFVRMEKDAVTGKPVTNIYDHYDAIGNAYNLCHALNMDMIHLDYMDNVGNDSRMQKLYDDLTFVDNPDMQTMLIDIYNNLKTEMSRNYACFDIYVFLTRGDIKNFVYNVQSVSEAMLSGNFITYKVLDRYEIAKVCTSLFNLHEFSVFDACENIMSGSGHSGIVPISVTHADGTVEDLGKTTSQKAQDAELRERRRKDAEVKAKEEKARKKKSKKNKKKGNSGGSVEQDELYVEGGDDNIDLF